MIVIFAASKLRAAFIEEAHMTFFILGFCLFSYACWRALAVYGAAIILHHVLMTVLIPRLVWTVEGAPDGIYHLAIHALIASVLFAPMMFTAEQLRKTLRSNEDAILEAKEATDNARAHATHAEQERRKAERKEAIVHETAGGIDGQLRALFKNILEAAVEVGRSARSVATISRTCNDNTGTVEQLFVRATSNIDEVARSADLLSRSVVEIAARAEAAALKAEGAVAESRQATRIVQALDASGQRVGDITRIIRTVADSINLLALNATIEAARAGEAGLGFAVVAQNVKTLAGQTSKATEEIASVIKKIQEETRRAALAINAIGESITSAHDDTAGIAVSTAQQKTMTAAIAESASRIAHESAEVRTQFAATLKLLASANTMSDDLLGASGSLRHMAETSTEECVALLAKLKQA